MPAARNPAARPPTTGDNPMMQLIRAAASLAPWKLAAVAVTSLAVINRVPALRQLVKMA